MGCLLLIFAVIIPRVVMAILFLLTDWFSIAFQTILWPLLGFIFMPYTTLAYMSAMVLNNHQITNGWLVLLIIAIIVDLGGHGGSYQRVQ